MNSLRGLLVTDGDKDWVSWAIGKVAESQDVPEHPAEPQTTMRVMR